MNPHTPLNNMLKIPTVLYGILVSKLFLQQKKCQRDFPNCD